MGLFDFFRTTTNIGEEIKREAQNNQRARSNSNEEILRNILTHKEEAPEKKKSSFERSYTMLQSIKL